MRLELCCAISVFLFGCSTNLQGTGLAAPDDVSNFANETTSHSLIAGGTMTAGEYLASSITLTNERCHEFFDGLEKVRQDSSFLDKILTAAAGIAATAKVTELAAGLATANTLNTTIADVYAFAAIRDQLKRHVQQDQDAYLRDRNLILGLITGDVAGPEDLPAAILAYRAYRENREPFGASLKTAAGRQLLMRMRFIYSKDPLDLVLARNIAAGYAALCSIGHMRGIIVASLDRTSQAKDDVQADANEKRRMGAPGGAAGEVSRSVTSQTAPGVPPVN